MTGSLTARKWGMRALVALGAIVSIIIWTFPIAWMILASFKSSEDIAAAQLTLAFKPTLEHYQTLFSRQNFLLYMMNSLTVALGATGVSVLFGGFAAYSLARFRTGGKHLAFWILSTRMAPPAVMVIPFFILFSKMGLLDTRIGLIIVYVAINLSFVTWMMRGFFEEAPVELEEAAMIDGATRMGAFWRITFPIVRPGLIASAIFCLAFCWNEFLFAMALAIMGAAKTLPAFANDFITGYDVNWGPLFASGTIIILPVIVFTLFVQRHMIRGLTMGAIK